MRRQGQPAKLDGGADGVAQDPEDLVSHLDRAGPVGHQGLGHVGGKHLGHPGLIVLGADEGLALAGEEMGGRVEGAVARGVAGHRPSEASPPAGPGQVLGCLVGRVVTPIEAGRLSVEARGHLGQQEGHQRLPGVDRALAQGDRRLRCEDARLVPAGQVGAAQ